MQDIVPAMPKGRKRPPMIGDLGRSSSVPAHLVFQPQQSMRATHHTSDPVANPRHFRRDSEPLTSVTSSFDAKPPPPNTPRPNLQKRPSDPTGSPLPAVAEAAPSKLHRAKTVQPQRSTFSPSQATSYENTVPPIMPRSAVSLETNKPVVKPTYSNWSVGSQQVGEEVSSDEDGDDGIYIRATEG